MAQVSYLNRLYLGRNRSDFTIIFNGHEYKVHLAIIAMKSTYFQSLIFKDFKENEDGSININIDHISQDQFEHFLQYLYDFAFDPTFVVPLLCLADYFQCDNLKKELEAFPFYRVSPSELNLANMAQLILPKLTLCETIKVTADELLWNILVWFTANINVFTLIDADVLSLIPFEWLRYVFGKAPLHLFKNETDKLDRALDIYSKLEHTKELFGALFEGINFCLIPFEDTLGAKYLPLYRTENEIVLQNIMEQRARSLTFEELKLLNNNNWKGCATLRLYIPNYKNAPKEEVLSKDARICKDVTSELRVKKFDTACTIFLYIQSSSSYTKFRVSFLLCVIENDLKEFKSRIVTSEVCRMNNAWIVEKWEFNTESCETVLFHVQILSLELID
jgi:hypothetical protein